jgi:putative ABC transport system permease protein
MIRFLLKGILRDRSRTLFPLITVVVGVFLTVVFFCWLNGILGNILDTSAKLGSGHVSVMTRAYAAESDQAPNDLALLGVTRLVDELRREFPEYQWTPRIRFGGLLDVPDEKGETRAQGPVAGMAVDLLSPGSPESGILDLGHALVKGKLPSKPGEALVSDALASRLDLRPGATVTLIASTMNGAMTTANFVLSGTLRFGTPAMDAGTVIADLRDVQDFLDMDDAAGEIAGFSRNGFYDQKKTEAVAAAFNGRHKKNGGEFDPVMDTLRHLSGLGAMLDSISGIVGLLLGVFILAMSIVLWNTGLMGNIRRHGEIGVRLSMGEDKGHVYRSMIAEALIIGVIGTFIGTALGLTLSYIVQAKGIDFSSLFRNASLLMSMRVRTRVIPASYIIGFIPGILATFLGAAMAGIRIYKRQTSKLLRELEG